MAFARDTYNGIVSDFTKIKCRLEKLVQRKREEEVVLREQADIIQVQARDAADEIRKAEHTIDKLAGFLAD
jgi:hypothetical protein